MNEAISDAVRELQKKGCKVLDTYIFIPSDHGCGNKSFGRIDNLVSKKYQVIYLSMNEKELTKTIRKVQGSKPFDATPSDKEVAIAIVNGVRK